MFEISKNRTPKSDPDDDDTIFSFKNYPFILNIENKTKFLFFDSKVKQIQNQREASYQMLATGVPQHPYLCLTVSRENIVREYFIVHNSFSIPKINRGYANATGNRCCRQS